MRDMNILITGIGGMVGRGVLKNIRDDYGDRFRLIGTNTVFPTNADHLCNSVYCVPLAENPQYIQEMRNICNAEKIELIIPTTDFEMYHLSPITLTL